MFQDNLGDYAFQAAVLLQPLFWIWLHDNRCINFPESTKYVFYLMTAWTAVVVYITGFEVGYYRNNLILQYIIMTVIAVLLINTRRSFKEALCLSFLATFLNSFYWEAPLHLAALLSGEPLANLLIQGWRLAPAVFLVKRYRFNTWARPTLAVGLLVSMTVMFLNFFVFRGGIIRGTLYAFNRVICLLLLTKTVVEAKRLMDPF